MAALVMAALVMAMVVMVAVVVCVVVGHNGRGARSNTHSFWMIVAVLVVVAMVVPVVVVFMMACKGITVDGGMGIVLWCKPQSGVKQSDTSYF